MIWTLSSGNPNSYLHIQINSGCCIVLSTLSNLAPTPVTPSFFSHVYAFVWLLFILFRLWACLVVPPKDPYLQDWLPKINTWDPHGVKREWALTSCPLISKRVPWCTHTHKHTRIQMSNRGVCPTCLRTLIQSFTKSRCAPVSRHTFPRIVSKVRSDWIHCKMLRWFDADLQSLRVLPSYMFGSPFALTVWKIV